MFGLIEIENNADVALKTLTDALNAHLGSEVYKYIATGKIGTDVITTALMYKPATVEPLGAFKLMNGTVSPAWDDSLHRPGLTQTFGSVETGEKFTVVVNHLKSKGSACPTGNDPQQGNCNGPRRPRRPGARDVAGDRPDGSGDRRPRAHHRRPQLVRQGRPDHGADHGRLHRSAAQVPG